MQCSQFLNKKKRLTDILQVNLFIQFRCWQRVIFPGSGPPSIFTAKSLYDRVRDGNGWFPLAWSPANASSNTLKIAQDINYHQLLNFLRKALVRLVMLG